MSKQTPMNIMVDLETMGTHHSSGILTIGACIVDGLAQDCEFYHKIKWTTLEPAGFIIDPDTMKWWDGPHNRIARAEAFSGTEELTTVLDNFNTWCAEISGGNFLLWSKPASFDLSLLKDAMDKFGIVPAWTHQEERCFRTLEKTFHWIKKPPFIGTAHNALADAKNQAAHLALILEHIQENQFDINGDNPRIYNER